MPRISVIIPAFNEEGMLSGAIRSAQGADGVEVIVVDGGSTDATCTAAVRSCVSLVKACRGRGSQMNAGARVARGGILLFLHADTRLPAGYAEEVERIMDDPSNLAGAFRMGFDRTTPSLRLIQQAANLRSLRLQLPYGDQAIFLRRDTFRQMGGYREVPVMEDYDLIRRLRKAGRVRIASSSVVTSARRYLLNGPWRTVLKHQRMILAWHLGRPVDSRPVVRVDSKPVS